MSWNSWEFLWMQFLWTNGSLEGSGNQMNIKSLESICIVASPFLFERDFHRMVRENLTVPCRYLSQDSAEFYHKILEQIMQWKKKIKKYTDCWEKSKLTLFLWFHDLNISYLEMPRKRNVQLTWDSYAWICVHNQCVHLQNAYTITIVVNIPA